MACTLQITQGRKIDRQWLGQSKLRLICFNRAILCQHYTESNKCNAGYNKLQVKSLYFNIKMWNSIDKVNSSPICSQFCSSAPDGQSAWPSQTHCLGMHWLEMFDPQENWFVAHTLAVQQINSAIWVTNYSSILLLISSVSQYKFH